MAQKGDLMTARSDIRVLDATIRDGGLVNNFMFSDDFINALYRTCLLYTSPSPRD